MVLRAASGPARLRAALLGGTLLAIVTAGACSGSSTPPAQPRVDASALCPATPELTVDRPCAPDGLRCAPDYRCGVTIATLSCTCTRGAFLCTDGTGNPITEGNALACTVGSFEGGTCPAAEGAAQFAPCSEPGLLCSYPSTCLGAFDSCQCFAGRTTAGGFGLRFECSSATCASRDAAAVLPTPRDAATAIDARNDSTTADAAEASATNDAGDASDAALILDSSSRPETGSTDAQPADAAVVEAAGD